VKEYEKYMRDPLGFASAQTDAMNMGDVFSWCQELFARAEAAEKALAEAMNQRNENARHLLGRTAKAERAHDEARAERDEALKDLRYAQADRNGNAVKLIEARAQLAERFTANEVIDITKAWCGGAEMEHSDLVEIAARIRKGRKP
jgi:hypothetical protein